MASTTRIPVLRIGRPMETGPAPERRAIDDQTVVSVGP